VKKAFLDYVSAKYSLQGYVQCDNFAKFDVAEDKLKTDIASDGDPRINVKAIQTGWKFDASQGSDDKAMTEEIDRSKNYCSNNVLLGGLYSCSCFADKMFAYRKVHGMYQPFINVVQSVVMDANFRECVGPAPQIAAYGSKRALQVLKPNPQYAGKLDVLSKCTGDGFTTLFLAKPVANMIPVSGDFNAALNRCIQQTH
jgi:hypothetical protein